MRGTREPFYVAQFGLDSLGALIKECFGEAFPDIRIKNQVLYLFDYLNDLGAKSIVCETEYLDRGYLEDYSNYYVSCFGGYQRTCARLHFFNATITHEKLLTLLSAEPKRQHLSKLQKSYLGFTVIKPIPKTFVGRTCLAPYPDLVNEPSREVITRQCKASLFGLELTVDSVVFQEQDKVISACVTSALWSLFHGLPHVNRRRLASPSEIALAAASDGRAEINSFPTKGLSNAEIVRALDKFRLKHHALDLDEMPASTFLAICKSMIKSHHPVLLGGAILSEDDSGKLRYRGEHAVTALGYSHDADAEPRFYVHDDRWGPYVRATLKSESAASLLESSPDHTSSRKGHASPGLSSLDNMPGFYLLLGRDNRGDQKAPIKELFVPNVVIIPCYKKVRISPDAIHDACDCMAVAVQGYLSPSDSGGNNESAYVDWEITLELSNSLKSGILNDSGVLNKSESLLTHMPRFVWFATARIQGKRFFSLVVDATDIQNGRALVCALHYVDEASNGFLTFLRGGRFKEYLDSKKSEQVPLVEQIRKGLAPHSEGEAEYLNRAFGPPRAPQYIRPTEVSPDNQLYGSEEDCEIYYDFDPDQPESRVLEILRSGGGVGIWAVSESGALLLGREEDGRGHPTITGASSARIAGEIWWSSESSSYEINSKSGRYSKNYGSVDSARFLRNALRKFGVIFADRSFRSR